MELWNYEIILFVINYIEIIDLKQKEIMDYMYDY